ncbi:GDSL esterase/lipase At1g29670-like isoform X2 [Rutidosis leptorrhynchoides]|uniref:GDSL esterase/lipase At1g29670-like isoform X2 n=1 Tax=Rutidosis leptorrhynchoides TaxID=125765 RepID=UPI003A9983A1
MTFLGNQFQYKIWFIFLVLNRSKTVLVIGDHKFPCYFIFGDSLVDVGNNNELNTGAKANYLPYGIDFPQGPTGRFCNGLLAVDYVGLGFKEFIPPYATVKEEDVLTGVNYGSAGSGILEESGDNLGEHFGFDKQILHHKNVVSKIETLHGNKTYTQYYLKKCLYTINIGSNDYINNYFAPKVLDKPHDLTPEQFATALISKFSQNIILLYELGARKFTIAEIPQVGFSLAEIRLCANNISCVTEINYASSIFNAKQRTLLDELDNNLTEAKFVVPDFNIPTSALLQFNGDY